MLIISKYKDYYDYLQGIYGIDKKKVLNRTIERSCYVQEYIKIRNKESLFHQPEERLYFCGNLYSLYCRANYDYWWGRDKSKRYHSRHYGWNNNDDFDVVYEDDKIVWIKHNEEVQGDKHFDFPYYTLASRTTSLIEANAVPVLKHIYFDKVLAPDECYRQIEQFISYKEPEANSDPDDMNRYEGKGFDKKISFRNM